MDTYLLLDADGLAVDSVVIDPADPNSAAVLDALVQQTDGVYARVAGHARVDARLGPDKRPGIGARRNGRTWEHPKRIPGPVDDPTPPNSATPGGGKPAAT